MKKKEFLYDFLFLFFFFCSKMFESTGWILEEPQIADTRKYDLLIPTVIKPPDNLIRDNEKNMNQVPEIGIIQQYSFSSSLQRMSVIVRVLNTDHFRAYTKGSPEMIISLSKPETVPPNVAVELQKYTEQGYRVIAVGRNTISTPSFTKVKIYFHLNYVSLHFFRSESL